jgi:hypothetical protein
MPKKIIVKLDDDYVNSVGGDEDVFNMIVDALDFAGIESYVYEEEKPFSGKEVCS